MSDITTIGQTNVETLSEEDKLNTVEIDAITLKNAHQQLGQYLSQQIKLFIDANDSFSETSIRQARLNLARMSASMVCNRDLVDKGVLTDREYDDTVNGFNKMLLCMHWWANGAGLTGIYLEKGLPFSIDGRTITELELAMALQDDNVGCMSGMLYHPERDTYYLWHKEEESSFTFKGQTTNQYANVKFTMFPTEVTFNILSNEVPIKKVTTFIYPHLMPFVGFSYIDDKISGDAYFQCGDMLYVKRAYSKGGSMVNLAAWLILYLRNKVSAEKVFELLCPFADGAAYNIIQRQYNGEVYAKKVMVGGKLVQAASVARLKHSITALRQDNMFPQGEPGQEIKNTYPSGSSKDRSWFEARDNVHRQAVKMLDLVGDRFDIMLNILDMLGTEVKDYGFQSPYSHSWNVVSISRDASNCWSGAGNVPAKVKMDLEADKIRSEEDLKNLGVRIH